jgi:hypothetical protein
MSGGNTNRITVTGAHKYKATWTANDPNTTDTGHQSAL